MYNPVVSPHDPNMMMLESDMSGRYISRDGGRSWTMVHHDQITSAVRGGPPIFHPSRPGVIHALQGYRANTLLTSTDNGVKWGRWPDKRQLPPATDVVTRMFIDPAMPERLFVGTADGEVLFTDDQGKAWRRARGISGRVHRFVAARGSPPAARVIYVGTSENVFRSADGGKTFQPCSNGLPKGKPIKDFAGGSNDQVTMLYAALPCWLDGGKLAGGVYALGSGAEGWRRVMNPQIDVSTKRTSQWAQGDLPDYTHLAANDADPMRAYAYCAGTSYFPPNHSTIYRTDDGGRSWRAVWYVDPRFEQCNAAPDYQISYTGQSWQGRTNFLEISPTDPDVLFRGRVFLTTNGGKSWWPVHAIKANDATADATIRWITNGLVVTTTWHYYVDPHERRRHYIAYTDIGFARSLDAGQTWRWWGPSSGTKPVDADGENEGFPIPRRWINTCYELAFDPDIPGKIWGAFSGHHDIPNENSIWRGTGPSKWPGGVARSDDFGVTWTAVRKGIPDKPVLSVILDPTSPKGRRTLYAAVYDHGVYKSIDDGTTWTKAGTGLGHPDNTRVCRIQRHPSGTLFALVTGMRVPAGGSLTTKGVGLYRSTDGADTWELVNKTYPLLYPRDFAGDPDNVDIIYIGASDTSKDDAAQGGLHRSADGGKTWRRVLRKRKTHFGAYFHPKHKGWVYATCVGWSDAPEGSLFLSTDAGRTWQPFTQLPFSQINRVDFDPRQPEVIYVTTFGGSVWKGPAAPLERR
jgi:photosystem II stability/assembly factor-like uncharacterized protein